MNMDDRFLNYGDFLNESSSLEVAKDVHSSDKLSTLLNDVVEGKLPHIQVVPTPGADSYVGVAINDGSSISRVYVTPDPKVALVAIIVKNTGRTKPEEIASIIEYPDGYLNYVVFAGDRAMTQKEVADRFNFTYNTNDGNTISFMTSSPIRKTY
jgi:hypothetical protein